MSTHAQTQTVLHNFVGGLTDGENPSGLVIDGSGNLYGTTPSGGTYGGGIAFELHRATDGTWKEKVLHNFGSGTDGLEPVATLLLDAKGNLYGTTLEGGGGSCAVSSSGPVVGCGIVFELIHSADGSWPEKILHAFTGGTDGIWPRSNVIFDAVGNLYGTASLGGSHANCSLYAGGSLVGCGTVFELVHGKNGTWTGKILHNFGSGFDGTYPYGGMVFDNAGNLYGTASYGGAQGCGGALHTPSCGLVFELVPQTATGWKEKVLPNLGYTLLSGPTIDSSGNLYISANSGGSCGVDYAFYCGMVFEVLPNQSQSGWSAQEILNSGHDSSPSPVLVDETGNVYGTVQRTSGGLGFKEPDMVYQLISAANNEWTNITLYQFPNNGNKGALPSGTLARDAVGKLYGTTFVGGTADKGVVYQVVP